MNKKKVVVYGLGQAWESQKADLERLFDIIGYCDKKVRDMDGFIRKEDLDACNADYIYITSTKYCSEIEKELEALRTETISWKDIQGMVGSRFMEDNTDGLFPLSYRGKISEVQLRRELVPMMGKKEYFGFFLKLYLWALEGMNIGAGTSPETSGETNVLDFIGNRMGDGTLVLFDVGANVGEYTKLLLNYFGEKEVTIHSFEPSGITFETLERNVRGEKVILNHVGLGKEKSEAILYYDRENSGMASLYDRQLDYLGMELSKKEKVRIIPLDEYCRENGIEKIDFLKMDVEGNELDVLQGAEHMLRESRIRSIQFKFGGANLDSRTYFRDFWNLLHEKYTLYRILKDGLLPIVQYEECLDIFTCTNYFAVLKTL